MSTSIGSPGELLSAVPFIIGYKPEKSIVIIFLKDGEVEVGVRFNDDAMFSDELVEHMMSAISQANPNQAVIIAYVDSETLESPLLEQIRDMLSDHVKIIDALIVSKTMYRSVDCYDGNCCPSALPELENSLIAAEMVSKGKPMPFDSEQAMKESLSKLEEDSELNALIDSIPEINYEQDEELVHAEQREGVFAINTVLGYLKDKQANKITKSTIAKVIASLRDLQVRDYALGISNKDNRDAWLWLLNKSPKGYRAPVACLYAATSYEDGFATAARLALDVAKEDNPKYTLVDLLDGMFSKGMSPSIFESMRNELHPKVMKAMGLK